MNADEISIHSGSDSDFAPYDDEESKRDELTPLVSLEIRRRDVGGIG